jgi:predicted nucleotidyltransferase
VETIRLAQFYMAEIMLNFGYWNRMTRLEQYKNEIERLCKAYHVRRMYAFGSVLTDEYNSNSDIDLLVDFRDLRLEEYADNYFDFKFSLEELFNRPIDLLEEKAMKNPYLRKSILQNRQLLYGK